MLKVQELLLLKTRNAVVEFLPRRVLLADCFCLVIRDHLLRDTSKVPDDVFSREKDKVKVLLLVGCR